jgi:hypothetical protein
VRSELRRLQTIARALNCCPQHGTRLQCVCDYTWTGTAAEFEELGPLTEKMSPYVDPIRPNGRCRCGGKTWCRLCYEAAAAKITVPDDLFTAQERERYHALLQGIRRKGLSS